MLEGGGGGVIMDHGSDTYVTAGKWWKEEGVGIMIDFGSDTHVHAGKCWKGGGGWGGWYTFVEGGGGVNDTLGRTEIYMFVLMHVDKMNCL